MPHTECGYTILFYVADFLGPACFRDGHINIFYISYDLNSIGEWHYGLFIFAGVEFVSRHRHDQIVA
ncbi:hypothetical protein D3C80_2066890 [compost metagenome]